MSDISKIITDKPFEFKEPNTVGKCCKLDSAGTFTTKTKTECLNSGGFWISNTQTCPKQTRKTCCKYTSSGGSTTVTKTDNLTECACYNSGSKVRWGDYSSCPSNPPSLVSNSCCYWEASGDIYINKCAQVEDIQQCASLHQGSNDGLKYSFYSGQSCVSNGGDIICNGTKKTEDTLIPECAPDTGNECYKEEYVLGNCCEQLNDETVSCSIVPKPECNGFWNYLGYIKSCTSGSFCSGVYFPEKENGISTPRTASFSTLNSSTNPLEKLPSTYSSYQGGIYAGIFEPGVSTILGNEISGKAQTYRSNRKGPGTPNRRWIVILANTDIYLPVLSMNNRSTSSYDGFYNSQLASIQNLSENNINGFTDWYIPSKQEWEFITNNLQKDYTTSGFSPLDKEYYLTSTFLDVSSSTSLVYCQMNTTDKYGDIFVTPKQNITFNMRIRPIRRIYLGT